MRRMFEEEVPFNRWLGVRMLTLESGYAMAELPVREELVGHPHRRALHGGVLSALADAVGAIALWTVIGGDDLPLSTIDLRVDYLRPGKLEAIVVEATVLRAGRAVGVVDMKLFHRSAAADLIASARGAYSIRRGGRGEAQ